MSPRVLYVLLAGLGGLVSLSGCGARLPPVVPVRGSVLLDGKPLPKVNVTFVPMLEYFGSESNSRAVTDENGQFTPVCDYNDQVGAVAGDHIVLVSESDLPDEFQNVQDGRVIDAYLAKRGNRPIPPQYGVLIHSPLKIKIVPGQETVTLELTRDKSPRGQEIR
jgi:hypothetical protein